MQVGEQRVARLQQRDFPGLRLLHLHDHVGGSEYLARAVHDARAGIPIFVVVKVDAAPGFAFDYQMMTGGDQRSEEHTSELQSLMRISYAVFCLKKTILKDKLSNNKNADK